MVAALSGVLPLLSRWSLVLTDCIMDDALEEARDMSDLANTDAGSIGGEGAEANGDDGPPGAMPGAGGGEACGLCRLCC